MAALPAGALRRQLSGKPVGPAPAQCTDAAWSPDGKWMYFSADTGSGVHIWRQRFPDGKPEQITFGVTQEEGIHFAPDGRSFVTSIGTSQSTLWVHDSRGDRQITSEGYSFWPSISPADAGISGREPQILPKPRSRRRLDSRARPFSAGAAPEFEIVSTPGGGAA